MKVVRQEGVDGWRVAQERKVWDGWAEDVMGARRVREGGRVGVEGKRMGEMKGGQLSWDISASESTIVFVLGHERFGG